MEIVPDTESVYYTPIVNVIDTSLFSNDDLQLFCDSTEFIDKSRKMRRCRVKSRLNNSAKLSREEIFEVSEVDEKEYLKIANSACNDIDVNIQNLSADIEKIFESFNENVSVYDDKDTDLESQHTNNITYKKQEVKQNIDKPEVANMMLRTPASKLRFNLQMSSTPKTDVLKLVRTQQTRINSECKAIEKDNDNTAVSSVKAKISFFNELSKAGSRNPAPKVLKQRKPLPDLPKTISKASTIRESDNHAESVCWSPNFVKCRIKQFEKGEIHQNFADETNNYTPDTKEKPIRSVTAENLVSKLRSQYDTLSKTSSKLRLDCKDPPAFSHRLSTPKKYDIKPTTKSLLESSGKPKLTNHCQLSSIPEGQDKSHKGSTFGVSSTEKLPARNYDPFAESEKSLKRLGDIVHTIRSIREQGMTEISRDLFQIFKKSLIAANAKLAESKRHSVQINSNKRIAAVRPNVVPCSTFPRILRAIPKSPQTNIAAFNVRGTTNDSSDLDLTYERFVSSLERDKSK